MRISDWSSDVCSSDLRLAARRACAVTGVDLDTLTERQVAGEQSGIELGGQLLGAVLAEQVGAADVEVEQGVAGEQGEGLIALLAVAQQQRDVFRRVAGRVDDFQRSEEHTSELQSLMRISYAVFC